MRFTTRATFNSIDDFILGRGPTVWEGFDHSGPIAELKKGRNNLQTAANQGNQNTTSGQGIENATNKIAASEVNTQGGLSPLVSKQLANQKAQIGKGYSGAAAAADRGLAMRGMGTAPSGLTASIKNTAINNEGNAETGAVGNAFETQNRLNNTAYDPVIAANNAVSNSVNASTNAGTALNKAGSTLGDIGTGLSGLAGIVTPFLPPAAPMANFNPNIWKGGPTYMPGGGPTLQQPAVQVPISPLNLPIG